ncbi:hypothetical protein RMATCC62417_09165 [Rhizopus microsporus]|nr:hypothetical protein RMATCC62417_09165 [Rhizopus microsporus]
MTARYSYGHLSITKTETTNCGIIKQGIRRQRWTFGGQCMDIKGYIYVLADPHMVLDVKGNSTLDGARVILYHKKFGYDNTQLWDLIPAGDIPGEREVLFEADFL